MSEANKSTIGISFMPDMQLEQVPASGSVPAGEYYAATLAVVEVISQDPQTGRVTFEVPIPDTNGRYVATLDGEVFKLLLRKFPSALFKE